MDYYLDRRCTVINTADDNKEKNNYVDRENSQEQLSSKFIGMLFAIVVTIARYNLVSDMTEVTSSRLFFRMEKPCIRL